MFITRYSQGYTNPISRMVEDKKGKWVKVSDVNLAAYVLGFLFLVIVKLLVG